MRRQHGVPYPVRRQAGSAAVELALVLPMMLLLLWGLGTLGTAFYSQLAISRAAAEGARAVGFVSNYADLPEIEQQEALATVRLQVVNSLAFSLIAPLDASSYTSRHQWINENSELHIRVDTDTCDGADGDGDSVRVQVEFPYESLRLLPPIRLPLIGNLDGWMPRSLTGCAVAQV